MSLSNLNETGSFAFLALMIRMSSFPFSSKNIFATTKIVSFVIVPNNRKDGQVFSVESITDKISRVDFWHRLKQLVGQATMNGLYRDV